MGPYKAGKARLNPRYLFSNILDQTLIEIETLLCVANAVLSGSIRERGDHYVGI